MIKHWIEKAQNVAGDAAAEAKKQASDPTLLAKGMAAASSAQNMAQEKLDNMEETKDEVVMEASN